MKITLPLLALLHAVTATATPSTYSYTVEIDQNDLNYLKFTEEIQNITDTAEALQSKYKNNPNIRNRTIFALSLMATLQPTSSKCYPSSFENLFLPLGYVSRTEPFYFPIAEQITDDFIAQPLVYPMAAYLAREVYNTNHIIDIGCGCGHRAAELALYGFTVTGIDFGPNIQCAKKKYRNPIYQDRIEFIAIELGMGKTRNTRRLFSRNLESPAIIVASDIIEHLVDPFVLLSLIKRLLHSGAHAAVLSTPERDLIYGGIQAGPPSNDCHMREWNLIEFQSMLRCAPGIQLIASGLTLSNDAIQSFAATSIAVVTAEQEQLRTTSKKKIKTKVEVKAKNLCGDIDLIRANRYGTFVCNLKTPETEEHNGDSGSGSPKGNRMEFESTADFIAALSRFKVPFYIYEDDAITMNGFHEICEYGQREDAVLANALRTSNWRTYDPEAAQLFFVLIPFHQSYFCGSNASRLSHVEKSFSYWSPDDEKADWQAFDQKWHNLWGHRTHLERVERAVAVATSHMKTHPTVPHVMPAFSWQSSAWNYDSQIGNVEEASKIFPRWCWEALANMTLVRFEVYRMSSFHNSFQTGHLSGRTPSSLFNVQWEQTKNTVILPFAVHPDMPHVNDLTYVDWKANRDIMFWYHTTRKNSSHGATELRHFPIKHVQVFGNESSVGFAIPRQEWLQGFSRSKFCLVVRGDTPTSHSWTAALQACCIPVFISDHFADVALPFGDGNGPPSWLALESFAFLVAESEVLNNPNRMVDVVLEASEVEVEAKLKGLMEVRRLFMYDHPESLLVEALVWGQALVAN